NGNGELGDGTTTNRTTPVGVSGLGAGSDVTAIAAGAGHNLALERHHSTRAGGRRVGGELGDGTTTNRTTPVGVTGLGVGSGVVAIATGEGHSLALKSDGSVLAWGFNGNGELGDGTTTNRTTPVGVSGLGAGSNVTAIAAGAGHNLALARQQTT